MYLPTPPCIHIHMVMHYDTDMTISQISLCSFVPTNNSILFPFLIGKVTKPPAPPVPVRNLAMPKIQLQGSLSSMAPSFDLGSVVKSLFQKQ